MRHLQQTTYYSDGWHDEWGSYVGRVDTFGWTDADFRTFVRKQNRLAKERGDNIRLRSVEDEGGDY